MVDLLNKKRGYQKLIILIVSITLLVLATVGIFFVVNKSDNANEKNNVETNALKDEQNADEDKDKTDTQDKTEQSDDKVSETEDTEIKADNDTQTSETDTTDEQNTTTNTENETQDTATNTDNVTINNVVNNDNVATNTTNINNAVNNTIYEDTYFQEFIEEKIVNKPWENLAVNWKPVNFLGALLPADTSTRKPVIELSKLSSIAGNITTDSEITYTILATNTGNEVAKNVVISDTIDTEVLEIVSISDEGSLNDNTISWNIEAIEAGSTKTVIFKAKVKEISDDKVKEVENIVYSNIAKAIGDNIKDTVSNEVKNDYVKPIISGVKEAFVVRDSKEVKAEAVNELEKLVYKITLKNEGTLAKEVNVKDILPDNLENITLISHTDIGVINGNEITWKVTVPARVDIKTPSEVTLVYSATVIKGAKGTVTNNVTIEGEAPVTPTKTPIITFNKQFNIVGSTTDTNKVTTDDIIEYNIVIENTGEVDAKNITITDTIPTGTTFVENSISDEGILNNGVITWNINVPANSYDVVSFRVKVNRDPQGNVIKNTAFVNGNKTPETVNDYVRPNLIVEKTASKATVKAGEKITYTIKVTNNGTCKGTEVVTDTVPLDQVTLDTINNNGKLEDSKLKWNVTLGINESINLTYTVTVKNTATKVVNSVVSEDGSTSTVTTPVVEIAKEAIGTIRPNGTITYKLKVTNKSDIDVTNVVISDEIPENTTFKAGSAVPTNTSFVDNIVKWENQTIAKNSTVNYEFKVDVSATVALGTKIENTAYVNTTPSNTTDTVVEEARIKAVKSVNKDAAKAGDTLVYTIKVSNNGNIPGTTTVIDTIPTGTQYVANSLLLDFQISDKLKIENNVIKLENYELAAKQEITITFNVTVNENVTNIIKNKANYTDNGTDKSTEEIVTNTISKSVINVQGEEIKNGNVKADEILTYTITIDNTSNSKTKEVNIKDSVPQGTELIENSISDSEYVTISEDKKNVEWNLTVAANSVKTVSFNVKVLKASKEFDIKNIASVNDNSTNEVVNHYVRPNFVVVKTSDKKVVKAGEKITYTLTVTNKGTCEGTETITDIIPVDSVDVVTYSGASFSNGKLTWDISLEKGATTTVTYQVQVKDTATKVVNVATTPDGSSSENIVPVVTVTKSAKATVKPSGLIEYTITVENKSDVDATSVTISDAIPANTTLVQTETIAPTYSEFTNNTLYWNNQTIKANSIKVYKFSVKANYNIALGTIIENTAIIDNSTSNTVKTKVEDAVISGVKSVDKTIAKAGDILTYTITLGNNGNISELATVTDVIPEGTTYVENSAKLNGAISDKITIENNTIKLTNVEVLPQTQTATNKVELTFQVTVNSNVTSVINNQAQIESDSKTTNTEKIVTNVISKSVVDETGADINSQNVHAIQKLKYNIKVSNKGNEDTTPVTFSVKDEIPTGTTLVQDSITDNGKVENGIISWDITLNANEEKTVSFIVEVTDTLANKVLISNTASVNEINTNTVTNTYVGPVLESEKVSIVNDKIEGTNAVKVGDIITYQINVTNKGDYKAENVKVEDSAPVGTELVSGTPTTSIAVIEPGKTETVEFKVKVTTANAKINNIAKVNGEETNSTDNPVLEISKDSQVKLSSKILTSSRIAAGDILTTGTILKYSISVKNNTDVKAENVVITDSVPAGTKLIVDDTHKISHDGVTTDNKNIAWTLDVDKNSEVIVSFYVEALDNPNNTTITNKAYVNGDEVTKSDTYVKAVINGNKAAYITRNEELVEADAVVEGDVLTYKITLTNSGSLDKVVKVEDTLPSNLENITLLNYTDKASISGNTITWNVNVPQNSSIVLEYTGKVKIGATGTVINNVEIDDETVVTPTKNPILEIGKTATIVDKPNVDYVTTGDVVEYTISVKNTGEVVAENVVITDAVPAGTMLVAGSITESGTTTDNENITWNKDIAVGETLTLTFKVEVQKDPANNAIKNIAYVNNNPTDEVVTDYKRADFTVIKIADKEVIKAGEKITYTLTVENQGDIEATQVITDRIPVNDVTIDSIGNNGKFENNVITWPVTLGAGQKTTLSYVVTVKDTVTKVVNTAITPDGSESTEITPVVEIVKEARAAVKLDETIVYTISVENKSDVDSKAITITDKLSDKVVYIEGSANKGGSNVNGTITWTNQIIPASTKVIYMFTVKLADTAKIDDNITNTAVVGGNNSNTTTTQVQDADISVTKSVDKSAAKAGEVLTYTINIFNTGNIAGNVTITDTIPEGTTYIANSAKLNNATVSNLTVQNNIVTLQNAAIEPADGVSSTLTFQVTVNNNVEKVVKNKATYTIDNETTDTNEVVTPIISKAVVNSQNVDINSTDVKVNDILTYNITINNTNNNNNIVVNVEDTIPNGTELVADSITDGGVNAGSLIEWNNITVLANSVKTISFRVKVLDINNNYKINNTAYVNSIATNNVQNNYVEPIISGSKSSNKNGVEVNPGETITYTLTATNDGGLEKTGVVITDTIPANTTFVSAQDRITPVDGVLTWTVTVPKYSSVSKTFTVKVNDDVVADSITNTATINGKSTDTVEHTIHYDDILVHMVKTTDVIKKKNIVMVLDLSSSMEGGSGRLAKAKKAAVDFIKDIYTSDEVTGVNIKFITFNSAKPLYFMDSKVPYSGTSNLTFGNNLTTATNKTEADQLITAINNIYIPDYYYYSGFGTHINAALTLANSNVDSLKTAYPNNDNVVVFLGDGKPEDSYSNNDPDLNIKPTANTIKSKATLYTIGFQMDSEGQTLMRAICTQPTAEELEENPNAKYWYTAETEDDLRAAFEAIETSEGTEDDEKTAYRAKLDYVLDGTLVLSNEEPKKGLIIDIDGTKHEFYTLAEIEASSIVSYDSDTNILSLNLRSEDTSEVYVYYRVS